MRHVVITRPQPEAQQWVQQLTAQGCQACAVPLMDIGPCTHPAAQAAVQQALAQLASFQAVMFVSGNAVRYFFARLHDQGLHLPATTRLWAPGPGTAQALLHAQQPSTQLDQPPADAAQFDSEALWAVVHSQVHPGHRTLMVRGSDAHALRPGAGTGRTWLTQRLQAHGGQVDFAPVYERRAPAATPTLLDHIQALRAQSALWLFSSSECISHLRQLTPQADWQAHTALCTHPRIAQQAMHAGFGRVIDTPPTVTAIAASIKSLP